MSIRPLHGTLSSLIRGIGSCVRWPLDHLLPNYAHLFGFETLLPCYLILLSHTFLVTMSVVATLKEEISTWVGLRIAHSSLLLLSVLNLSIALPLSDATASTFRCYLLLLSFLFDSIIFIHLSFGDTQILEDDNEKHELRCHNDAMTVAFIGHAHASLQLLILPGVWRLAEETFSVTTFCFFIYGSFLWIIVATVFVVSKSEAQERAICNLKVARISHKPVALKRHVVVLVVDNVLLLLSQYS